MRRFALSLAVFMTAAAARGGDYTFDVSQIVGSYLGDDALAPPVAVSLDLGMTFAEIDSAAIHYTGTQSVGRYGDLNSDLVFPLPADLLSSFVTGGGKSVLAETILPGESGPFDATVTFQAIGQPPAEPVFADWLDGQVEFDFNAATPLLVATTYMIDMPAVEITSAQLVISGQPELDAFMIQGDFTGDGLIDSGDVDVWKRSLGLTADADANRNGATDGGDFLIWQRNATADVLATTAPEPSSLALVLLALTVGATRRRR